MKGVLTDPAERVAFKLRQPAIRRFSESEPSSRGTIALPPVTLNQSAYLARQSYRHFKQEPLPLEAFSALLAGLQPMTSAALPKYRYGSAGSLYPIQCYLYIKPNRVVGLETGIYYYHPLEHRLILIAPEAELDQSLHGGVNRTIFNESAFSLFLVSDMSAIEPMYGQMSRDFCLLEAGYMSQLLMEEAPEHNLGLCPIGGMQFEPIRPLFELNDNQEMLHSFLGGVISQEQKSSLPAPEAIQAKTEDKVKSFLSLHLPAYMVPNHYIVVDSLPLTPNGKVDRKALPIPDLNQLAKSLVVPANETEQSLMAILEALLKREGISVTDNFFDIGANSLDFIQIYNAIKKEWGIEISIMELFQRANVREIADLLNTQINAEQDNFEEIDL
jgi:SagB-type dehydrogenase family enzyme